MDLTPRQADVLLVIRNHRHLHGHAPTYRELAAALQLSRAACVAHVNAMIRKGLLRKAPRKARTLEVVADASGVERPPGKKKNSLTRSIHGEIVHPPQQVTPVLTAVVGVCRWREVTAG